MDRTMTRLTMCALAILAATATQARAGAAAKVPDNAVVTRQFRVAGTHALVPAATAARQNLYVWQVAQGSWDGQLLDGLSLVLVQPLSEDGQPAGQTSIYVSDLATSDQRDALISALAASNPQLFPSRTSAGVRIEPAVITIEFDGQNFVLHLGLIALGPAPQIVRTA